MHHFVFVPPRDCFFSSACGKIRRGAKAVLRPLLPGMIQSDADQRRLKVTVTVNTTGLGTPFTM